MNATQLNDLRPLLFTVAYKMTKSTFQSDDIVQDVLMNFTERNPPHVEDLRRYLAKSVIYKCLDVLKQEKRSYVGVDLPEPVTDNFLLSEIRHDISFGIVIILQTLSPSERACFVLRECFDFSYEELASILERSEDSCRQLLHRAKEKVSQRKSGQFSKEKTDEFKSIFIQACHTGDLTKLIAHFKEEVVLYADGGGKAKTAINPIISAEFVTRYLSNGYEKFGHLLSYHTLSCNGNPAVASVNKTTGEIDSLFILEGVGNDITSIYVIRNPEKLRQIKV